MNRPSHQTLGALKNAVVGETYAEFATGARVQTVDGYPGRVTAVLDGPFPQTETYEVALDNGLGGGEYTARQLRPLTERTAAVVEEPMSAEASEIHLASEDYPELGTILYDRPPNERVKVYAGLQSMAGETKSYADLRFSLEPGYLAAHHPHHGEVGGVSFSHDPVQNRVQIIDLNTDPGHQRRGVATQLMSELERRHPGAVFDHGPRTEDGRAWADHVYGPQSSSGYDDEEGYWNSRDTRDGRVVGGLQHSAAVEQIPPPSACSWCGHDQFTNPTNTGRGMRMECAQCGGTMTSWGGQWQPDMTSSPENHPRRDADSRAVINDPSAVHASLTADSWDHWLAPETIASRRNFGERVMARYDLLDLGDPAASAVAVDPRSDPVGYLRGITAQANDDPDLGFHMLATWAEVREKAKRIKDSGGVRILAASAQGVVGEVQGEHALYESAFNYVPGTRKLADWNCGCKWGAYAWGRSPAYRRFEGRKCSHVTALQFEAQSRGMFGQDVAEDRQRLPGQYQRSPVTVQYERPTERADGGNLNRRSVPPGNMRRIFSSSVNRLPVHEFMGRFEPAEYSVNGDWDEVEQHPNFWKRNPLNYKRIHSGTWDAFVAHVRDHGIQEPVVVNPESGQVESGHHRVIAAKWTDQDVPYVHEDGLDHLAIRIANMRRTYASSSYDAWSQAIENVAQKHDEISHDLWHNHGQDSEHGDLASSLRLVPTLARENFRDSEGREPEDHELAPHIEGALMDHPLYAEVQDEVQRLRHHLAALDLAPVHVFAREMAQAGDTPDAVFRMLANHGVTQDNALRIVRWAVTGDDDGGSTQPGEDIPGITTRDTTEFKKRPHHHDHHTNDTRRHAPDFGRGIGWYAPGLMWCDQCNGSGCGHCGGSGEVMQGVSPTGGPGVGDLSTTTSPIADEDADAGEDVSGGLSTGASVHVGTLEDLAHRGYCTDEWNRWQQGDCYTYAHALLRMNPNLRMGGSGQEPDEVGHHVFAHDQMHAYDSAGKHSLPYSGVHGDLIHQEYGYTAETQPYDYPDENAIPAAIDHARRNGILEGRYGPQFGKHTGASLQQHQWLLQHYADASTSLMGGNPAPANNPLTPHSDSRNPGSTGWGTSADPHAWTHPIINNSYEIAAEASAHIGVTPEEHAPYWDSESESPPCREPWCVTNEAPHSEAEHIDPPHLDRGHPDYHSAERSIEEAFGHHSDADWLMGQQSTGPTKYSALSTTGGVVGQESLPEYTHAGLALKAADTGRVLMIQRSFKDDKDPAKGTWEFPGGGKEDGDQTSLHTGIREWQEEVGQPFPEGGHVSHTWRAGTYHGHVVTIPSENQVDFSQGRSTTNPDDPDGDDHEQAAWWDPQHAKKNPALRQELKKDNPFGAIEKAAAFLTMDQVLEVARAEERRTGKSSEQLLREHVAWQEQRLAEMLSNGSVTSADSVRGNPEVGTYKAAASAPTTAHSAAREDHPHNQVRWDQGYSHGLHGENALFDRNLEDSVVYEFRPRDPMRAYLDGHEHGQTERASFPVHPDTDWLLDQGEQGPSKYSALHEPPEPALPSTDGAVEDDPAPEVDDTGWQPGDPAPGQYLSAQPDIPWGYPGGPSDPPPLQMSGSLDDIPLDQLVVAFQSTAMGRQLAADAATAPPTEVAAAGGRQRGDIPPPPEILAENAQLAAIAQAVLAGEIEVGENGISKSSMKNFDLTEQQELITEGANDGTLARNFDGLQIEGTHYALLDDPDMAGWM